MNKSDQIGELALALSKAQSVIRGVMEDSLNPHFKNKYASLQSVIDAIREPLGQHQLAGLQGLDQLHGAALGRAGEPACRAAGALEGIAGREPVLIAALRHPADVSIHAFYTCS